MTRSELLDRLRELKPWLESQGVVDLRLFGSFARDEARDDSDVDLLCQADAVFGWNLWGIEAELADRLGRKVELIEDCTLHPIVRKRAQADLMHV